MHGKRPGSKKANYRVRRRKLKSVILTPNSCGGRAPVLEAGEHRAVRHNTRRRSLNHYDSREPSGRLEGHSRFYFRLYHLSSSQRDSKGALWCCVASCAPLFVCALLCFSPATTFYAPQPIFSSVGGILPSSCISPNLWCLRRENLCRGR